MASAKLSAQQLAIKFLSIAERTEKELHDYLIDKEVEKDEVATVLVWAKSKRYVDNERVIDREVDLMKGKLQGINKLKSRLEKRGLDTAQLSQSVGDELLTAKTLIKKRKLTDKQKAARLLFSRGFSEEAILETLEHWDEIIESQADKQFGL